MTARAALRVGAAGLALALFLITSVFGLYTPLPSSAGVAYVFAWPEGATALICLGAAVGSVAALYLVVAIAVRRVGAGSRDAAEARWLWPITWCGAIALGLLPALPGVGKIAAPVAYFLYDLRWWWAAAAAAQLVVNIDRLAGAPIARAAGRWSGGAAETRRLILDAAVFSVVIAWAATTSPLIRFDAVLHGDEPKYIRLCETLYQGKGIEIGHKVLMDERPIDAPSRVTANLRWIVRAIGDDARLMAGDVAEFARHPLTFQWNRAEARPNWFLVGRNGDQYQVHQPGYSLLLFPAYYIDRHLLGVTPGYQNEFPDTLLMTHLASLLMFGLCGVALFRLLRHVTAHDGRAALLAAVGVMTLPTVAFPFQLYPEIPAALVVITVTTVLVFHRARATAVAGAATGMAAGFLLWLHPRFTLLFLVFLALAWFNLAGAARRRFLVAAALVALAWCGVCYHITGSWLPTALYDSDANSHAFLLSIVPINMLANVFDRTWGLVPHTPMLLAVPAGLALVWRRGRRDLAALVAIGLALAITTAAHGLSAAGATPGRHMLAVLPLAMWPIALLVDRVKADAWRRAAIALLVLLSLDAALAYNLEHVKDVGRLVAARVSGWKPNLAFPAPRADAARGVLPVAAGWLAFSGLLVGGTLWLIGRVRVQRARAMPAAVAVAAGAGLLLTSMSPDWISSDYLPSPAAAARRAAADLVTRDRCRLCFASTRARFDWTAITPNAVRGLILGVEVDASGRGVFDLTLDRDAPRDPYNDVPAFGRARVDFGDGAFSPWVGVVDAAILTHTYTSGGPRRITATLELPDGGERVVRQTIDVGISTGIPIK